MSEKIPANEPVIDRPPVTGDVAPPTVNEEGAPQTRIGRFRIPTESLRAYTILFALIVIWIYFQWATVDERHPYGLFLGAVNFSKLLQQTVVTGILAVGMLMVIVAAQIDLSIGSVVGLAGGIAAIAQGWGVVVPLGDALSTTFFGLPIGPAIIGVSLLILALFLTIKLLGLERKLSLRFLMAVVVAIAVGLGAFFVARLLLTSYGGSSISLAPMIVTGTLLGLTAGIIASVRLKRGSWNVLLERGGWKQPLPAFVVVAIGLLVGLMGGILGAELVGRLGWGDWRGWLLILALGSPIIIGLTIGALQGSLVAYANIPAFIVTLGGLLAWRGVVLWRMEGATVPVTLPAWRSIGEGFIAPVGGVVLAAIAIAAIAWFTFRRNRARKQHGLPVAGLPATLARIIVPSIVIAIFVYMMNTQGGVPIPVFIFLTVAVIGAFLTQNTTFGRYLYAVGGNPDAARLSGISLRRHILAAFCVMGALAGLAAITYTARNGSASPDAGNLMELEAIAACVIGGTSLMGGRGTVFGACLGALIMASLNNGMSLLDVQNHVQLIVKGVVLVAAVGFDMFGRRRV